MTPADVAEMARERDRYDRDCALADLAAHPVVVATYYDDARMARVLVWSNGDRAVERIKHDGSWRWEPLDRVRHADLFAYADAERAD